MSYGWFHIAQIWTECVIFAFVGNTPFAGVTKISRKVVSLLRNQQGYLIFNWICGLTIPICILFKFGNNQIGITNFIMSLKFLLKVFPLLWDPYSSNFDWLCSFIIPIYVPSLVALKYVNYDFHKISKICIPLKVVFFL